MMKKEPKCSVCPDDVKSIPKNLKKYQVGTNFLKESASPPKIPKELQRFDVKPKGTSGVIKKDIGPEATYHKVVDGVKARFNDKTPDSLSENLLEFVDPSGMSSYDDAGKAYSKWGKENSFLPTGEEALDMFGAVPMLGKFSKLKYLVEGKGLMKSAYKYFPWQKAVNTVDGSQDVYSDNLKVEGTESSVKRRKTIEENTSKFKTPLSKYQTGGKSEDVLYNIDRAKELGYKPDETGHMDSVDNTNGMWLKSKKHPTAWKELMAYTLNLDLQRKLKHPIVNQEGYFGDDQLQYQEKTLPKYQVGTPTYSGGMLPMATVSSPMSESPIARNLRVKKALQEGRDVNTAKTAKEREFENTVKELSGAGSVERIYNNPKKTAVGTAKALANIAALPVGVGQGLSEVVRGKEFNMGNNPLTGGKYSEGFDEALDVATVLPALGLAGKGVRATGKAVKAIPIVDKGISTAKTLQKRANDLISEYRTPTIKGYTEGNFVHSLKKTSRRWKEYEAFNAQLQNNVQVASTNHDLAIQNAWSKLFKYNQHQKELGRKASNIDYTLRKSSTNIDDLAISKNNISPQYAYWLESKGMLQDALRNKSKYLNDHDLVDKFLENYTKSQRGVVLPKTASQQEVIDALTTTETRHGKMLGDGNYSSNSPKIRKQFATPTDETGQGWSGQLKLKLPFDSRTPSEKVKLLRNLTYDNAEFPLRSEISSKPIVEGTYGGGSQRRLDGKFFKDNPEFLELEDFAKEDVVPDPLTHTKKGYFGLKDADMDPNIFRRPPHAIEIIKEVKKHDTPIKRIVQVGQNKTKAEKAAMEMFRVRQKKFVNIVDTKKKELTGRELAAWENAAKEANALRAGMEKIENINYNIKNGVGTSIPIGLVAGIGTGIVTYESPRDAEQTRKWLKARAEFKKKNEKVNLPKYQEGGPIPTMADSLFLLNNNKEIAKLIASGYTKTRDQDLKNPPYFSVKEAQDKVQKIYEEDLAAGYKVPSHDKYMSTRGNLVGTSDWAFSGGDDKGMPRHFVHPNIVPQYQADFSDNRTKNTRPSVFTYGYDDLAITPWSKLSPEDKAKRLKLYGKAGTPQDPKWGTKPADKKVVQPPIDPEVVAKQKLIGVTPDGVWGKKSEAAWQEYNKSKLAIDSKLDTSNWEQSSLDSLNLYNSTTAAKEMIAKYGNANPLTQRVQVKILQDALDKNNATRESPALKSELVKSNNAPGGNPTSGYYVNHFQKPVGVQKKVEQVSSVVPSSITAPTPIVKKDIERLMMPSGSYMQKEDFIKKYGESAWRKASGQK